MIGGWIKKLLGLHDVTHLTEALGRANEVRKAVHAKAIKVALDGSDDTEHLFITLNAARRIIQGKRGDE